MSFYVIKDIQNKLEDLNRNQHIQIFRMLNRELPKIIEMMEDCDDCSIIDAKKITNDDLIIFKEIIEKVEELKKT
jgi:hypothetical protein